MKYSFELNNAVSGNYQIGDKGAFKRMVEICSALFRGEDISKFGADVDKVATKLKESASRAAMGDANARMEINEIVKAFEELTSEDLPEVKLKEFVGHTPFQVMAGMAIGIVNGILAHYFFL